MIKYSAILLGLYIAYYVGNIVYDLFLKKERTIITDESEEFTLGDLVSENPIQVSIDDVEDIIAPNSFQQKELIPTNEENFRPNLDELRQQFESEQEFDFESSLNAPVQEIIKEKEVEEKNNWKDIMRMSETMVQVVANYDGQKVYHSTI